MKVQVCLQVATSIPPARCNVHLFWWILLWNYPKYNHVFLRTNVYHSKNPFYNLVTRFITWNKWHYMARNILSIVSNIILLWVCQIQLSLLSIIGLNSDRFLSRSSLCRIYLTKYLAAFSFNIVKWALNISNRYKMIFEIFNTLLSIWFCVWILPTCVSNKHVSLWIAVNKLKMISTNDCDNSDSNFKLNWAQISCHF